MAFDPVDGHSDKRAMHRGYSDGMTRAFELVLTPAILGAFGWGLDSWLGFFPILTIVFTVLGVVGVFVKMWLGYEAEMRGHDERFRARTGAAS